MQHCFEPNCDSILLQCYSGENIKHNGKKLTFKKLQFYSIKDERIKTLDSY